MTKIDTSTEAVERLLDGVTPGPWAAEGEDQGAAWGMAWSVCRADNLLNCVADGVDTEANVRFIAAARDLVPALLKERDEARAQLAASQPADPALRAAPSLRITGPNSDGEYWLHIKAGGRSGGVNLGGEHGPIYKLLLDAASETGAKE